MSFDPADLAKAIDDCLVLVEKPARYLDGEINAARKTWTADRVRWLLILPDTYEIGMSHQGLRILYDILNRHEHTLAERAFAPWLDMEARMRAKGLPLFSLESRRPARDFDIIGFSLAYELLATNVVNMLDLADIPIWSRDRGDEHPLIAGGGPCCANPEPVADFFDFFLIGDGEDAVEEITRLLRTVRGRPRAERLRALAGLPGVYVPRFYQPVFANGRQADLRASGQGTYPVRRVYVTDLDRAIYPHRPLVPLIEAVQDRVTLEIQRGCTRGCRFCQAGIFYRPVRERGPQRLVEILAASLAASGWSDVSLSSLSSGDYSQIAPLTRALIDGLYPQRIGISFSSLRADAFSVELADLVARVRKTGLTFAPEAGGERLRRAINKNLSDDDILTAAEAAYASGWKRIKLYFMIGLPTETDDDVQAIAQLLSRIRGLARRYGRTRSVTASIGAFVPKAHTPFQWEAFADRATLREKLAFLREHARERGIDLKWHDVDVSFIEAVLSRGDRRLGAVIHRVWEQGGRFDGWTDQFSIERWETALEESGIDPRVWTGARDTHDPLPWDHIDLGVTQDWLRRERAFAFEGVVTPDCREGRCHSCGIAGPGDRVTAPELDCDTWSDLAARLTNATLPRAARPEDEAARYRIAYAKRGPLRFISHLEIARLLIRLFRMARWPLAFTAGHSPRPKVSFGPALPLGIEGWNELLDLTLARPLSPAEFAQVNEVAPAGFSLLGRALIEHRTLSLMEQASAADYAVGLPDDLFAQARRERRLEDFAGADVMLVDKPGKGRMRSIDLKRAIAMIRWSETSHGPALDLTLLLRQVDGHVIGPAAVLQAIFKWTAEDLGRCRIARRHLLDAEGRPLGPV